ncbi:protealysin inhibitor emfourin [Microbacterium sp. A82]|uniref:protealysin inhibitor emfourin n=1 Tax=Microbacterium sp. A82 TaxID=3450452 RepID=UPI003F3C1E8A
MNEIDAPNDSAGTTSPVMIAVVRSGGVAGIRRRWEVEPLHPDVDVWITLIERCPWSDPKETSPGADRYVWSIRARIAREERERELAESELTGAWRELVDAVRGAAATAPDAPTSLE